MLIMGNMDKLDWQACLNTPGVTVPDEHIIGSKGKCRPHHIDLTWSRLHKSHQGLGGTRLEAGHEQLGYLDHTHIETHY